jgi:MYXO-CTERM domain-containing protein
VYLRVIGAVDELAILDNSGATGALRLTLASRMTAFLRRSDGTLWVASFDGSLHVSTDNGLTFPKRASSPHIRGLAERDGWVYAATDNAVDGYGAARTQDGITWEPLMRFKDLCGLRSQGCSAVVEACTSPWSALVERFSIVPPAACGNATSDGGTGGGDGGSAGTPATSGGCGCGSTSGPTAVLLAVLLVVFFGRRATEARALRARARRSPRRRW